MLVYCDTTMLLRLVVAEPGTPLAVALWDGADALVTARLSDIEVRATLRAAGRAGALSAPGADGALQAWERFSRSLRWLEFTPEVARLAARAADTHPIRASDAVHLASALTLAGSETVMAVFERRLATAASSEGLRVLPRFG